MWSRVPMWTRTADLFFKSSQFASANLGKINIGCSYRHLYTGERLGLDRFEKNKLYIHDKLGEQKDRFKKRMKEQLVELQAGGMIFSDDLKLMLHITDTEEDMEVVSQMIYKFSAQERELHFSSFQFGPIVMRLMHSQRAADKAFELFMDESLESFFNQSSTSHVLMDLLLIEERYEQLLEVYDKICTNNSDASIPPDCTALALAACYRLNNSMSMERTTATLQRCLQTSSLVTPRARCFAAALALLQDNLPAAGAALDSVDATRNNLACNVRLQLMSRLERTDDVLQLLRHVAEQQLPELVRAPVIYADTLQKLNQITMNDEQSAQREALVQKAQDADRLSSSSLDEHLFKPMGAFRRKYDQMQQHGFKQRQRTPPRWQQRRNQYAGLTEL